MRLKSRGNDRCYVFIFRAQYSSRRAESQRNGNRSRLSHKGKIGGKRYEHHQKRRYKKLQLKQLFRIVGAGGSRYRAYCYQGVHPVSACVKDQAQQKYGNQKSYPEKEKIVPYLVHRVAEKAGCRAAHRQRPRQSGFHYQPHIFISVRHGVRYHLDKLVKFHLYSPTREKTRIASPLSVIKSSFLQPSILAET